FTAIARVVDEMCANAPVRARLINFTHESIDLIKQVQLLLLDFGIKSRVTLDSTSGIPAENRSHSLILDLPETKRFQSLIGFDPRSEKTSALAGIVAGIADPTPEVITDRVFNYPECGIEPVYDLTEPTTHHFVANGIVVHNCSEYAFLDDTACNLASLNLIKFYGPLSTEGERGMGERGRGEGGRFDVEAFRHATRIWTLILEISV